MAIYDSFPWTSVHELNLSWVIQCVKAGNIKIDEFTEALEQFAEDYATLSALAAAFTIAGSNISTTKNFSAASLSGPLTGNVTGNLTGNVTGNVTGNITGDVTGNVTGDVTGNADTATYATSAGSATTATNATNASHATTADSATTATSATSATTANSSTTAININLTTAITSTDMDDYLPSSTGLAVYQTGNNLTTHVPDNLEYEGAIIIAVNTSIGTCAIQAAWFPVASDNTYMRYRVGNAWGSWKKLTQANV